MNSAGITLEALVERFNDSKQALETAAEKLNNIALAEDGAQQAARAVDSAAETLRELSGRLGESTDTLAKALETARGLLERAHEILDASEIAAMRAEFTAIRTDVANQTESMALGLSEADARTSAKIDQLSSLVAESAKERDARAEAEKRLQAALDVMSDRQRRRAGV